MVAGNGGFCLYANGKNNSPALLTLSQYSAA
jgi:hypothetical protein